ncbi:MAG: hypothetical protein H0W04_01985 [Chthoniobacterales bacterium]|nr:hypothetical protein [Chthoniobacterales bacterium]
MPSRFLSAFLGLVSVLYVNAAESRTDAVRELAAFSVFEKVDLAQLKGDAKPLRGPAMSNSRFQSVQTCWVSPGTPAQVSAALRNFNPARYPELKVLLQVGGSSFAALSSAPDNAAVQWLKDATEKKSPDLQLSREEAGKPGAFAQFWAAILSARASAGLSSQPSYDHTGQNIRPGEEISSLLGQQPKIRKQFGGLAGSKGDQFWELLDLGGKGVLALGATNNRGVAEGALQVADVLYYASGGFYAALTLYQLWPVQVDGKPSTLVWRGDMISSAELAGLAGVERLGSESAMIKDVARAVRVFRKESGSR